jgi:hypothetical protein
MPQAGSVDAPSPSPAPSSQDTAKELPSRWWVAGLTPAERLRPSGQPVRPEENDRLNRAQRRLERWRDAHGLGNNDHLAKLPDERGSDADGLHALLAEAPRDLGDRAVPTTDRPAWAETVEAVLRATPVEKTTPTRSPGSGPRHRMEIRPGRPASRRSSRRSCASPSSDSPPRRVPTGWTIWPT